MRQKLFMTISALMCVMMLFSSCGKKETKEEKDDMRAKLEADENLVAFVDEVPVTQADYNLMYKLGYEQTVQYSQSYGEDWYNAEIDDDGTTIGAYMKNIAMDSITELIAVEKLAGKKGIKVEESYIDEQVAMIKEKQGGDSGFEEFLKEYRTTEEAVRKYVGRAELYNRLIESLSAEGGDANVSEDRIFLEFEEKYVRVQHILIQSTPENDAQALAKAKEVIKKLGEGADFDSLIDEYNEDPGMTSGNYYTFTDGTMVKEFEVASKNLQVGEYTKEPVKTDYGYHIIKKYELSRDCEEFTEFKNEKVQSNINSMIEEKIDAMDVIKKDNAIDKYVESWIKELGVISDPESDNQSQE